MSNNQEQQNTLSSIRHDHLIIKSMISPNARVLDIGCGDGALLELLREEKNVDGRRN